MRHNSKKYTFGVKAGKFLGFYLTERGIKDNPDKCRAVLEIALPSRKFWIMKLNRMLTTFNRFISKYTQHTLPFFIIIRKEANFEWTQECEKAFDKLKSIL